MSAGVDTLVASASIARVDARGGARGGLPFDGLTIGQNLKLRVLKQIDQQRYEVSLGAGRHIVESRVPLKVGTQVEARVEAKGRQLELRYLSDARFEDEELTENEAPQAAADAEPLQRWLQELAEQFRVPLDADSQATIARAATQAADPELMTRGGLFLKKLAHAVSPRYLAALYQAMSGASLSGGDETSAVVQFGELTGSAADAAALADAMDEGGQDPNGEGDAQRALRLLNLQDEGSLAWRYGTLPILVGGQLIELDLVMFREREQKAGRGGLKRLVMTLDTTHFGRVRVEARALDDHLMVKLRAPSADAVEMLSAYGNDVRAAIEQLGWQVDQVSYEIDAQGGGASRAIVEHVLAAGSVDREL
jgi:hypothetical protein